ncbi:MAG: RNA polymerase sigma factor [Planctomycetota bacterium]
MSLSDIELFLEFQENGAIELFEEIVNRHRKGVINFFYHFIWDTALAEDLAQEVFIKLAGGVKNYKPTARFTVFLYRIVQNVWIDYLRKKATLPHQISLEKAVGDDEENCLKDLIDDKSNSSLDDIIDAEEKTIIKNILKRLSNEQRMVVELSVFRHLGYSEISGILGIPLNTVKSRMRQAIINLKDLVKK